MRECSACRVQIAPFDRAMGLRPKSRLSPRMVKVTARMGAHMEFEGVARELQFLLGVSVSAKQAQLVTREAGRKAGELLARQTDYWTSPTRPQKPVEEEKAHAALVVGMDGTCVMGRDGEGHEVKVATVYGLDERAEKGGRGMLTDRRWCATSKGVAEFAPQVRALATRWGGRQAPRVAVLGDGAHWIWNLAADSFSRATCILDFYHASEHVHGMARDVWPRAEEKAREWARKWSERILQGDVDGLLEELGRLRETMSRPARERIRQEQTYFSNNRDRMDYPKYREQGWPIGSGCVEASCKTLVKKRMSNAGQRWSPDGIEEIVALRTAIFNEDFDEIWKQAA